MLLTRLYISCALLAAMCILGSGANTGLCGPADPSVPSINVSFEQAVSLPSGLTSIKGIVGRAARFSGSPGSHIEMPAPGFGAPATVSVWVRVGCPRKDFRLISALDGDKDQIGTVRFQGCRVQVWSGETWNELVPFIAVNGSWQHLAIAFREDGTATGYVNGREKLSARCGFGFAGVRLGIGAGFKATSGSAFAGDMDEFRVYRKALTKDEVRRLYSAKLFERAEREDGTALTALGKVALKESMEPVRPGIPGVQPFWNGRSRRFIYAPAFDFAPVPGAKVYRFSATAKSDGSASQFEADTPTAALSPIWGKIPAGHVSLKVEGLDRPNGTPLGVAGTRDFIKSAPFNGPYKLRAYGYRECGVRSLSAQLKQQRFQSWLTKNWPDSECWYYSYASKMMGAVTSGMACYANLRPRPADAEQALEIARRSADLLISLTDKAPRPLAGWPPTYWNGLRPEHPTDYADRILTFYPAEAAMSYLDLYDATHDARYLAEARTVADTYLRLQLKCGTWYQIIDAKTGEPTVSNLLVPTFVVTFFDRLRESYGLTQYESAREKAFRWLMANPMRTYNWQGQFEDVAAMAPYEDLSRQEATEMSILLFKASGRHPEYLSMAEDLLRFAEDQFVLWDRRDAVAGADWAIPSALEQYVCYTPISYSNHSMIRACMAAYETTADRMYHAKAVALAYTLAVVAQDFGGGEIPTWMNYGAWPDNWINCSVYPAITLIDLDKALSAKP